jgi:hypothetical protein
MVPLRDFEALIARLQAIDVATRVGRSGVKLQGLKR